jgi:hypothetical protein
MRRRPMRGLGRVRPWRLRRASPSRVPSSVSSALSNPVSSSLSNSVSDSVAGRSMVAGDDQPE